MEKAIAEKLQTLMLQITSQLDDSTAFIRDNCPLQEFEAYRRVAGTLMGTILLEVEHKLWAEHPDLKPQQMGGTYEVSPTIYLPRFYEAR